MYCGVPTTMPAPVTVVARPTDFAMPKSMSTTRRDPVPIGRDDGAEVRVGVAGELTAGRAIERLYPHLQRAPDSRSRRRGKEATVVGPVMEIQDVATVEARRIERAGDRSVRR